MTTTDVFIPGASATITVPGTATLKFFAVSIAAGRDLIDTSHFGVTYKTRITGLHDMTGTLSGYAQTGNTTDNPLTDISGTLVITFATGCTVTLTAVIGNQTIGTDVNGAVVYTYTFANNSDTAPVVAWT